MDDKIKPIDPEQANASGIAGQRPTVGVGRALLFDFFGTLVVYEAERARLGYPETYALASSWGLAVTSEEFVRLWDEASQQLEAESRQTLREFTMTDSAAAFANRASLELSADQCVRLGVSFVEEWQQHVVPLDGVLEMVGRLAASWQVAIVSNTHDPNMVPAMLKTMGLTDLVDVILSVEHGRCKPHPSIYQAALVRLNVEVDRAVFIGDSHEADYAGPEAAGIRSYLIDPNCRHAIPTDRRLGTVLDIERVLRSDTIGIQDER